MCPLPSSLGAELTLALAAADTTRTTHPINMRVGRNWKREFEENNPFRKILQKIGFGLEDEIRSLYYRYG